MEKRFTVRRDDRAMPREDCWQLLNETNVGRLGLCTPDGSPYIVPLNHVVCENKIFFHCARSGRKLDIIRQNPQVCYEVDSLLGIITGIKACNFGAYYRSAIAFGEAYEVINPEEKAAVLNKLTAKNASSCQSYLPVTPEDATMVTVIGIKIKALTGKSHSRCTPE